jgi:hypothetical protein
MPGNLSFAGISVLAGFDSSEPYTSRDHSRYRRLGSGAGSQAAGNQIATG